MSLDDNRMLHTDTGRMSNNDWTQWKGHIKIQLYAKLAIKLNETEVQLKLNHDLNERS